jgi:hypothetical protein
MAKFPDGTLWRSSSALRRDAKRAR